MQSVNRTRFDGLRSIDTHTKQMQTERQKCSVVIWSAGWENRQRPQAISRILERSERLANMGRKRTANHDLPPRMHPQGRGVLPRHKHHAAQMDMPWLKPSASKAEMG